MFQLRPALKAILQFVDRDRASPPNRSLSLAHQLRCVSETTSSSEQAAEARAVIPSRGHNPASPKRFGTYLQRRRRDFASLRGVPSRGSQTRPSIATYEDWEPMPVAPLCPFRLAESKAGKVALSQFGIDSVGKGAF